MDQDLTATKRRGTISRPVQDPEYSTAVQTARDYYNSTDADTFYYEIWGGTDIHVGLYRGVEGLTDTDDIPKASARTVERMASYVGPDSSTRILDVGSGYGGSARHLAKKYGCKVTCLNLSEVENERNREANRAEGLDHLIDVVDGAFEAIPFKDDSFDVVWSQDAFSHSAERDRVVSEVARVLVPGGRFIFTDLMADDDTPVETLGPILERLHLTSMGTLGFYRKSTADAGFKDLGFDDLSKQLPLHYGRVLEETERRDSELSGTISAEYLKKMKAGLREWVARGEAGDLAWGIHRYQL